MDPNATLEMIRATIQQLVRTRYEDDWDSIMAHATELIESVEALDEWLSKGGFLPSAWKTPGPDSPYR